MSLRDTAATRIEAAAESAIELSHRIHSFPELGFEERNAAGWITDHLNRAGLAARSQVYDLETAVLAQTGTGPLVLTLCAEYDALPDLGHACGHNIISAVACLTAQALAPVVDDLGITLRVLGTPAEEYGGGKILMLERGAFEGTHAALMIHPAGRDCLEPLMQASAPLSVEYRGRAAHAAAWPERGINAADAITVAQVAIGLLRQHILGTDRVHGYVSRGGIAANVVPDYTEFGLTVRSERLEDLNRLRERVEACVEAGAIATGCTVDINELTPVYADMRHDRTIGAVFARNAALVGHPLSRPDAPERPAGSTDLGNVSHVLPAIHPLLRLDSEGATNHQAAFAKFCAQPTGDALVVQAARALVWTVIDLATDDQQRGDLLNAPLSRSPRP